MLQTNNFTSLIFCGIMALGSCSKKESTTPAAASGEAFIQIDDKKNAPVTQKVDPYYRGEAFRTYFATTTLDMTTKTGSNEAIVQIILTYQKDGNIPNFENEAAAKVLIEGIEEGKTITSRILGSASNSSGAAMAGFQLTGSVSAGTGVWDSGYAGDADAELKITKSGGKIILSVENDIPITTGKRGGAGNPAYPNFTATTKFTLKMP